MNPSTVNVGFYAIQSKRLTDGKVSQSTTVWPKEVAERWVAEWNEEPEFKGKLVFSIVPISEAKETK